MGQYNIPPPPFGSCVPYPNQGVELLVFRIRFEPPLTENPFWGGSGVSKIHPRFNEVENHESLGVFQFRAKKVFSGPDSMGFGRAH